MAFHERLRHLRQRAGLTQEQLAIKAGATGNMGTLWEKSPANGGSVPRLATLVEMVRVLDTNADYLLGLSDDDRPVTERDKTMAAYKEADRLC